MSIFNSSVFRYSAFKLSLFKRPLFKRSVFNRSAILMLFKAMLFQAMLFQVMLAACVSAQAESQETIAEPSTSLSTEAPAKPVRKVASGVLPQLAVFLRTPLYLPNGPVPPKTPVKYTRSLPFMGQALIDRGYKIPLPYGVSFIAVNNLQGQDITDLNVAMGKGGAPDEGSELRPYPAVNIGSNSHTQTAQLKLDAWVLPFLNLYVVAGKVTGNADINVKINTSDAPEICIPNPIPIKPPICSGNDFEGEFLIPIQASVDRTTASIGLTAAYGIGSWFTSFSASYTDSYGSKSTDIASVSAGIRSGRRLFFANGVLFTPLFGISYMDLDTRVTGRTSLKDAFPNGDDLHVLYNVQLNNTDKYSGIMGFSIGIPKGMGFVFEWNKSEQSERFLLSAEYRF